MMISKRKQSFLLVLLSLVISALSRTIRALINVFERGARGKKGGERHEEIAIEKERERMCVKKHTQKSCQLIRLLFVCFVNQRAVHSYY